jgi:hypothetical protein
MMMYTFDYARFGRDTDRKFHGMFTFGPVFYVATLLINGMVGIFLAQTIKVEGGISEISVVLGIVSMMGFAGVLLIWVSQTRINTANFYLASTNLQSFLARVFKLRLPRTVCVVLVGGIVYAVMLTDVFSFILDALRYQGVFIVAWVGVALTHIAWERQRGIKPEQLEFRPGRVPLFNPAGLIAWFGSAGVGILMLEIKSIQPFGGTWSAPITFVLSIAIYYVSLQFARRSWFVLDRPNDPRHEVDDVWETRVRCHKCDKSYVAMEMDRDPEAGHQAICAECATESSTYYRAAHAESQQSGGSGDADRPLTTA